VALCTGHYARKVRLEWAGAEDLFGADASHFPFRSLLRKTRSRRMILSKDSDQAFSVRRPTSLRWRGLLASA
jgi:hypothetical protein